MIINFYNQGGGGSGSGMTPQQVQQQIDTSLNPYWDSGETKDYVDEAVSGISLEGYYTSAQTEERIASAYTILDEHITEVERVTSSAYTELHDDIIELSARTIPDMSLYTPTTGFSTINGSAITNGGNIEIQAGGDMSAYWTSAETQSYVEGEGFAYEEDVEEIAEVTAGAINTLQTDVSEKTEFRKHVYVSLENLASSIEFNQAFFDVDGDDEPVSYIDIFKAGELINMTEMRSDAAYTFSIDPSSYLIWYDAEENNGELIPAGFYSLAFSKIAEGENFTNVTFRVAIGGSDSEDIEALNVTTTTGNTIRKAIEKYNNDWALNRDRVFIVRQDGYPTEWFFKDDVKYFEIAFTDDGEGNWAYEVNIEYANTVHTKDDGFGLIKNIMKIEQSAYGALVNDGITDPETFYVVIPDQQ